MLRLNYFLSQDIISPGVQKTTPQLFHLGVNYRSHAGIVDCAQSVVELLTSFWPNSIDKLSAERGLMDGPKPIYFNDWNEDYEKFRKLLFGDT